MAVCFAAIVPLPALRGPPLTRFLILFLVSAAAYAAAVLSLDRVTLSTRNLWGFALVFRLTMLLVSPPTLSDDVYRYLWDGRLANAGVNPYAFTVDASQLDRFDSPHRLQVNNAWMASPYLPVAQVFFAAVCRLAPDSTFAFQFAAVLLDLLTGWLVADLLRRLALPRERVLVYLWNPLVVVEFAHGAHVDALMICLMMLALWALVAGRRLVGQAEEKPTAECQTFHFPSSVPNRILRGGLVSPLMLAAATLTKGLPALLLSLLVWRWGWRRMLLYVGIVAAVLLLCALGAGWGLTGPQDGEGLFGALRIYAARWNYNGGLYHWLEVGLSGYRTPGAVPPEIVGEWPIRIAKMAMGTLMGLVLITVACKARRCVDDLSLLRLATIPLGAYLLLTTTVHPWYVTLITPLLPFLVSREGEESAYARFLWPWIWLSAAVALSYLTYLDPANLREYSWARLVEYVPIYLLLIWCAWSASGGVDRFGRD